MEKFVYKKAIGITVLTASFSDFRYTKHCHGEYAFGVTLRGIQQYNMNGSLQSSRPGGIMLFNPEQVHDGMSREKTGVDYVMAYINTELFSELTGRKEYERFSSPVVYNTKLRRSIQNLVDVIFRGEEEALCCELLLALADNFSQTQKGRAWGNNNALMNKAKEMIYYNLDLDKILKLDDVCKEINMSKYQFIRMFEANAGITPYQFYLNCKVEKAKQLIERYKDVYLAVAECGFVDLSHMNKLFKSRYGVTAFDYMLNIS